MEEEEDALRRVLLLGVGLDRGRGEGTGEWKSGRVGEGERGEEKGEKGEKGIRWKGHHVEGQECAWRCPLVVAANIREGPAGHTWTCGTRRQQRFAVPHAPHAVPVAA